MPCQSMTTISIYKKGSPIFVNMILIHLVNAVSVDCPNLINLAIQLGMNTAQPTIMSQLNTNCCTAQGIICLNARVVQLDWNYLNPSLNGTINASLLPPLLTSIRISNNQLTGMIPQTWPSGLQVLSLNVNLLKGKIPSTWPTDLLVLNLGGNPSLICESPGPWP